MIFDRVTLLELKTNKKFSVSALTLEICMSEVDIACAGILLEDTSQVQIWS
jgi:hypothetical protein